MSCPQLSHEPPRPCSRDGCEQQHREHLQFVWVMVMIMMMVVMTSKRPLAENLLISGVT